VGEPAPGALLTISGFRVLSWSLWESSVRGVHYEVEPPRGHHFTDQLMRLRRKVFLPLSLEMVVVDAGVLRFAGIASK